MERLTYQDKDGGVYLPWERNSANGSYDIWDEDGLIQQINRLAAYEDTGLEPEETKGFAEDVAYQFGYYFPIKDILYISTGGLSTLEWAFRILGWNDPHPVPECECEFPGCHEHATCGTPTKDGYKRLCGKHFAELAREEAEAALSQEGDSER